jgi:hypothetical protein
VSVDGTAEMKATFIANEECLLLTVALFSCLLEPFTKFQTSVRIIAMQRLRDVYFK